jgi:hypothetical protein
MLPQLLALHAISAADVGLVMPRADPAKCVRSLLPLIGWEAGGKVRRWRRRCCCCCCCCAGLALCAGGEAAGATLPTHPLAVQPAHHPPRPAPPQEEASQRRAAERTICILALTEAFCREARSLEGALVSELVLELGKIISRHAFVVVVAAACRCGAPRGPATPALGAAVLGVSMGPYSVSSCPRVAGGAQHHPCRSHPAGACARWRGSTPACRAASRRWRARCTRRRSRSWPRRASTSRCWAAGASRWATCAGAQQRRGGAARLPPAPAAARG